MSRGGIVETRDVEPKVAKVGEPADVLWKALHALHWWLMRSTRWQRSTRGRVGRELLLLVRAAVRIGRRCWVVGVSPRCVRRVT